MQNQVQQQQHQQQQQDQQQQAARAAQQAVAVAQQQQQQQHQAQQQQMIRNVNQTQNQQYPNVSNPGAYLRPPQAPRSWSTMQSQPRQSNQSALIAQLTTPTFQQRLDSKYNLKLTSVN